jgi:4-amino-4-deoxy-L-arabinose transferase-like glycosyltransferase
MPEKSETGETSLPDRDAKFRRVVALFLVLLLASVFRFVDLSGNPPALFTDEASAGYDAYSLLLTGRDQYGERLPLFARSFGDYDEAMYRYLAIVPIKLFGLNEASVRLPAACAGVLTVLFLYLLVRRLRDERTAFFAALMLAISPWHIQFSRVAFRGILFPLFLVAGLYLLMLGLKRPKMLIGAAVVLALSLWTYAPARVFVPLFLIGVGFLVRRDLAVTGRWGIAAGVVFLAVGGFLAGFWISPHGLSRAGYTVTRDPIQWGLNYLTYFDPRFLWLSGDPCLRHSLPGMGMLHWIEMLAVPAGLVALARRRPAADTILLLWLMLYPIPAAMTEGRHALRAIVGAPLMAILSGIGLDWLDSILERRRMAWRAGFAVVLAASVVMLAARLFVQYPHVSGGAWNYGLKQAIALAQEKPAAQVYVSCRFVMPHIYILFYTRYDPASYQTHPLNTLSQGHWHYSSFDAGRYRVLPVSKMAETERGPRLFVVAPDEAVRLQGFIPCRESACIGTPDGKTVVVLLEPREDEIRTNP